MQPVSATGDDEQASSRNCHDVAPVVCAFSSVEITLKTFENRPKTTGSQQAQTSISVLAAVFARQRMNNPLRLRQSVDVR
jgi:hypothetical protein